MWPRLTAIILCGMLTASCGFQLRSFQFAQEIESACIEGETSSELAIELKIQLWKLGIACDKTESADVRIRLDKLQFTKKALLMSPREGMLEYELILSTSYSITIATDKDDSKPIAISERQRVKVNPDKLLSTAAEDRVVRTEMIQRTAENMLLDLSVRLRSRSTSTNVVATANGN